MKEMKTFCRYNPQTIQWVLGEIILDGSDLTGWWLCKRDWGLKQKCFSCWLWRSKPLCCERASWLGPRTAPLRAYSDLWLTASKQTNIQIKTRGHGPRATKKWILLMSWMSLEKKPNLLMRLQPSLTSWNLVRP